MSSRKYFPFKGSPHPKDIIYSARAKIGASGAIDVVVEDLADQTSESDSGLTITNTATGRYWIDISGRLRSIKSATLSMAGPDTGAFPTTTGINPMWRGEVTTSGAPVQFTRIDTMADSNPASGTWLHVEIIGSEAA